VGRGTRTPQRRVLRRPLFSRNHALAYRACVGPCTLGRAGVQCVFWHKRFKAMWAIYSQDPQRKASILVLWPVLSISSSESLRHRDRRKPSKYQPRPAARIEKTGYANPLPRTCTGCASHASHATGPRAERCGHTNTSWKACRTCFVGAPRRCSS